MDQKSFSTGIVGAVSAVGREVLSVLEERDFPAGSLTAFEKVRPEDAALELRGEQIPVCPAADADLSAVDVLFVCQDGVMDLKRAAAEVVDRGGLVIDAASGEGQERGPLIVPEVNADLLRRLCRERSSGKGVRAAGPNPSSVLLSVVLGPLVRAYGIERAVISAYYGASWAGQPGMDELWAQTLAVFQQGDMPRGALGGQLAFNCIPLVGQVKEDGATAEEEETAEHLLTVLDCPGLEMSYTAALIPVMSCHSFSITLFTGSEVEGAQALEHLRQSPGLIVLEAHDEASYPAPFELPGSDAVYVSRVRTNPRLPRSLSLWAAGDDLRKGAALNMVETAEIALAAMNE